MRLITPSPVRPSSLLQSVAHIVRPLRVRYRLRRVLRACSFIVAHRQLPGAYGPFLSGKRSMECRSEGRNPMSLRNLGKSRRHSSQMAIPRPPYKRHEVWFGFVQRSITARHTPYSGVFFAKCVRLLHPQLVERPVLRLFQATGRFFPHLHRQSQYVSSHRDGLSAIIVHRENTFPTRSRRYGKVNLQGA